MTALPELRLRGRGSRCQSVAKHDLGHLCPVRRPAGRGIDHLRGLPEILRTDRGRCDHAERLDVDCGVVFDDLRLPHMAVLQFPGPDGVRPGMFAERASMSKQAMNQLLRSLEALDYLARSDAPDEGRARLVHMTKRGRAAYAKMHDILRDIEREWRAELGAKEFAQLKGLLSRVWESPLTR